MNKRILSVIVFGAALLSAQAQDGKGGISPAMLGPVSYTHLDVYKRQPQGDGRKRMGVWRGRRGALRAGYARPAVP